MFEFLVGLFFSVWAIFESTKDETSPRFYKKPCYKKVYEKLFKTKIFLR